MVYGDGSKSSKSSIDASHYLVNLACKLLIYHLNK